MVESPRLGWGELACRSTAKQRLHAIMRRFFLRPARAMHVACKPMRGKEQVLTHALALPGPESAHVGALRQGLRAQALECAAHELHSQQQSMS